MVRTGRLHGKLPMCIQVKICNNTSLFRRQYKLLLIQCTYCVFSVQPLIRQSTHLQKSLQSPKQVYLPQCQKRYRQFPVIHQQLLWSSPTRLREFCWLHWVRLWRIQLIYIYMYPSKAHTMFCLVCSDNRNTNNHHDLWRDSRNLSSLKQKKVSWRKESSLSFFSGCFVQVVYT